MIIDYELIVRQGHQPNINLKTLSRGMLRQILQLPDLLRMVSVLRMAERLPEMCMGDR